ncbi:MAG: NRDE family protein [Rhodospirillaceae bacterium]
MCTLVILRRPGHDWPTIIAANRDEMVTRAWKAPGRHWPDRAHVTAGIDELAGGTWLGINDHRVAAGILNRTGSLGPQDGKRSRGELPLEALDHAEAAVAAEALSHLDGSAYRSFNLIVADATDAYWISSDGGKPHVRVKPVPDGVSLITSRDLNDLGAERIGKYRPLFETAPAPDPAAGKDGWGPWIDLLADFKEWEVGQERGSMAFRTDYGFETVSSSLVALPRPGDTALKPKYLFCPTLPARGGYAPVI